jgi:hypothetical protein
VRTNDERLTTDDQRDYFAGDGGVLVGELLAGALPVGAGAGVGAGVAGAAGTLAGLTGTGGAGAPLTTDPGPR